MPIGDENVSAGLNVNESVKTAKTYADNIINGGDIEVGKLRSSSKGDTIGFNLKDLAKHMLVVGTPGSGFGPAGEGYFRLTAFGNAEKTVEAVERIKKAYKK